MASFALYGMIDIVLGVMFDVRFKSYFIILQKNLIFTIEFGYYKSLKISVTLAILRINKSLIIQSKVIFQPQKIKVSIKPCVNWAIKTVIHHQKWFTRNAHLVENHAKTYITRWNIATQSFRGHVLTALPFSEFISIDFGGMWFNVNESNEMCLIKS